MPRLSRRELLRLGAASTAGAGLSALARATVAQDVGGDGTDGGSADPRPDIVVILTDAERHHVHFPDGFIERAMPSWGRLAERGLTYERAYTAASQCSPSRASILTGVYPETHDVTHLGYPSPVLPDAASLPTIATILRDVGYDVVWKGKWHLSFAAGFEGGPWTGQVWSEDDIIDLEERYEVAEWNPPEAGNLAFAEDGALASLGGGTADNDARIASGTVTPGQTPAFGESAVEFLERVGRVPAAERPPFCLFVSLVNPHDVVFWPDGFEDGGYALADVAGLDVELPPSVDDALDTKPSIQATFRDAMDAQAPLESDAAKVDYARIYAYLHGVVDGHIEDVLDALERNGLTDDTIVIRTADHGEMAMAHGLRDKAYNAYEETIHVPLVISNPGLFPEAATTTALWSHVDLLPTIAALAGAEPVGVGISHVPVLADPASIAQDAVLFTYDDAFILDRDVGNSHIRAMRTGRWMYAVYYAVDGSAFEYELYDLEQDPDELVNLLHEPDASMIETWTGLHRRLTDLLEEKQATPGGVTWPSDPADA